MQWRILTRTRQFLESHPELRKPNDTNQNTAFILLRNPPFSCIMKVISLYPKISIFSKSGGKSCGAAKISH